MDDEQPELRQAAPGSCPRCGDPVPIRGKGRPRTWCSQRCRRAAYEERRAAASGAIAVQLVERVVQRAVTPGGHDLSECSRRVIDSPAACRRVLRALTELARSQELQRDPKWQATLRAVAELADALVARRSGSRYLR